MKIVLEHGILSKAKDAINDKKRREAKRGKTVGNQVVKKAKGVCNAGWTH